MSPKYRVSYYVCGRRFVATIVAASTAHAKQSIQQQVSGATLLIATRMN